MTFTEAALEILKAEGRPMRSREIAEKAVDKGLLSHVGKTPVQTMSTRLSAAVAKGKGPFVRERPGVFGLAEWGGNPPGPAPKKEVAAPVSAQKPEPSPQKTRSEPRTELPPRPTASATDKATGKSVPPPRPTASATDKATGKSVPPPRPTASATDKDTGESVPAWKKKKRRRKSKAEKPARDTKPEQSPDRNENEKKRRPVPERKIKPPAGSKSSPPAPGKGELVEKFESILRSQTRPIPTEKLSDQVGIGFDSGVILADALLMSNGLDRESKGLRPKFVRHKGGVALAEREVSSEIISLETQISDARDRLVRIVERQILRKLRTLSMKAFVRMMVVYLERTGFGAMEPVQRGGKGEFHMSVQDRRHEGRFRTAVVIRCDSADVPLSDQAVIDLRGALHRYNSTSGIIATTGTVSEKAKAESTVPNLAPVALLSGEMIARDMVQFGVGAEDRTVKFPSFDKAFFSQLES